MEITGDVEGLKREILETARRESAEIISAAEAEADRILSSARVTVGQDRREMLASVVTAAARRREMLLAAVPAEAGRQRSTRQEVLLNFIRSDAASRMPAEAAAAGKAAILAALAAQSVSHMEGKKFIVALGPSDMDAAAGLPAEIERLAGRGRLEIIVEENPGLDGGVIVRDGDGRQYWDNSFKARLERLWPELRVKMLDGEGVEGEGR